jgi:hypothetical protein
MNKDQDEDLKAREEVSALSILFLIGTIIFAGTYLTREGIADLIRRFIERRGRY